MTPYGKDFFNDEYVVFVSVSADEIVKTLWSIIQPTSVVDVGCGIGLFLAAFAAKGVKELCGIDGPWVTPEQLHISREQFIAHDLTAPIHLERHFDLVMCLEVAEHLPSESAPTLVESLVRLGQVVLFSAAVPLQGGVSHINEQWPEYWVALFAKSGYQAVDCIRRRIWENKKVLWYYSQNAILFVEESFLQTHDGLRSEFERPTGMPLSVIHPRRLLDYENPKPRRIPFRDVLSLGKKWAIQNCKSVLGTSRDR
jgi:SAM-dependent methyltransferase